MIQEVRIPAPDLQASDRSLSDTSSGLGNNPSNTSAGDSGGNKSDNDDDNPSSASVGEQNTLSLMVCWQSRNVERG